MDLPQFGDKRGPHCYGLPNPPLSLPVIHYKDGTQDDPRFDTQGKIGGPPPGHTAKTSSPSMGNAGTAEERRVLNNLLGPVYDKPAGSLPDITDLLWGPLLRGAAVNLS